MRQALRLTVCSPPQKLLNLDGSMSLLPLLLHARAARTDARRVARATEASTSEADCVCTSDYYMTLVTWGSGGVTAPLVSQMCIPSYVRDL